MSKLTTYSVWHDSQEQWDANDIDPPALQCEAISFAAAAEQLADEWDDDYKHGYFIVRDDETKRYRQIELKRCWYVKSDNPITLDEMCSP